MWWAASSRWVISSTERAEPTELLSALMDAEPSRPDRIEIALAEGLRVAVDRDVDAAALWRVLGVLERRRSRL